MGLKADSLNVNDMITFDPKKTEHRSPSAAIPAGGFLRFSIRVKRAAAAVSATLFLHKDGEGKVPYPMGWSGLAGAEDVYAAEINITTAGLYFYSFLVETPDGEVKAGRGVCGAAETGAAEDFVLRVTKNGYRPSRKLYGGVIYQIFPDRFSDGGQRKKTRGDARYRTDWGGVPYFLPEKNGKVLNNDFFGGNLYGIAEKLPYLKALGVTCIYLNPIFRAYSNHKYDTGDYMEVDPDFGGGAAFDGLISKAAGHGIDIILDGVFSHTGADSRYFNKYGNYNGTGAYQSKDSKYYKWYKFRRFPDEYECWWDFDTLPNVIEDEPSYDAFINGADGVAAHWLKKGAAGWRLDVADELPDGFLDNFNRAVKAARPDAVIIGEVWEDAAAKEAYGRRRRYFSGGQLDGVMNYPLKDGIIGFVNGRGIAGLAGAFHMMLDHYPAGSLHTLMNILGTHDTARILTELGGDKNKLKAAAALQFTAPGVPAVYYGDEAGVTGGKDPFCRACFPWGKEDKALTAYYRRLGAIRKRYRGVFAAGGTEILYSKDSVFIFRRLGRAAELITAVNAGPRDFEFELSREYKCLLSGKTYAGGCRLAAGESVILAPAQGRL